MKMMKKIIQISSYFDREDEDIQYHIWLLNNSYLVTSIHGPLGGFERLEEAEDFAEHLVS